MLIVGINVCYVPIADIAQQAAAVAAGQMTTYKSVSGGRHRSAVMQDSLLLPLLILLVVANGTAVGAKKLLGAASARPLDGGALVVDGQPISGPRKPSEASWCPCWRRPSARRSSITSRSLSSPCWPAPVAAAVEHSRHCGRGDDSSLRADWSCRPSFQVESSRRAPLTAIVSSTGGG
jgi:hypothetical protein